MQDKMLALFCLAGLVCGLASAQAPTSSCHDLDTSGCQIFQHAMPDLCNDAGFSQSTCKRFCGNCPIECYDCPSAVIDPDDCNVTTICGPNETCMTKHLLAKDGHHEYIMTCERKEICTGLAFGFGKRAAGDEGSRTARNIMIDCCDTDFCNLPMQATTTTTMPPTPGMLPGGPCLRDVVFAVDDSGSVGSSNFKHAMTFIGDVVSQLDVGPNSAHVSVMAFSTHPQIEWFLNNYNTKTQVLNALQHVKYSTGMTHTSEALQAVRTQILNSNHGDRPGVENAVIVLTDGKSNNPASTAQEALALQKVSKDVIAIGVGSGTSTNELHSIATNGNHVFSISGYPNLPGLVPQIVNILCS